MKIVCYFFSGTGNTRRVCELLMAELNGEGHETILYPIAAGNAPPMPKDADMLLVGYPVHAFNAPAPVINFLKTLPQGSGRSCFLVRTSGEPLKLNHAAGITPKRILRRKGFSVKGEFHYVMPYNIIFRHSDGMAARMNLAMERRIADDARSVANNEGALCRNGIFRRIVSFVLRIEHPAIKKIGRRFRVSDDCVGCGKCETVCPQGNIRMQDGKPVFGKNCAGCMGCSFFCPKDALRIGILNGWRVNGEYSFGGAPASDEEVCRYCRKSYLKYFHRYET